MSYKRKTQKLHQYTIIAGLVSPHICNLILKTNFTVCRVVTVVAKE